MRIVIKIGDEILIFWAINIIVSLVGLNLFCLLLTGCMTGPDYAHGGGASSRMEHYPADWGWLKPTNEINRIVNNEHLAIDRHNFYTQ